MISASSWFLPAMVVSFSRYPSRSMWTPVLWKGRATRVPFCRTVKCWCKLTVIPGIRSSTDLVQENERVFRASFFTNTVKPLADVQSLVRTY